MTLGGGKFPCLQVQSQLYTQSLWSKGGVLGGFWLVPRLSAVSLSHCVAHLQTERAQLEDGRFVYRLLRSPMCEYLVNFLHKLRQLPERYMMNSVLENFTILQVTHWGRQAGL